MTLDSDQKGALRPLSFASPKTLPLTGQTFVKVSSKDLFRDRGWVLGGLSRLLCWKMHSFSSCFQNAPTGAAGVQKQTKQWICRQTSRTTPTAGSCHERKCGFRVNFSFSRVQDDMKSNGGYLRSSVVCSSKISVVVRSNWS